MFAVMMMMLNTLLNLKLNLPAVQSFVVSVIMIIPILLSGGKTATFATVAMIVINLILMFLRARVLGKSIILSSSFILFPIAVATVTSLSTQMWTLRRAFSVFTILSQGSAEGGATGHSITHGLELFSQHPVFGIGWGNAVKYQRHEIHNTPVSILAEGGMFGITGFIILIIFLFSFLHSKIPEPKSR